MEKRTRTVTITLTERQADILVRALDLYSRIGIGQICEVRQVWNRFYRSFQPDMDMVQRLLDHAKYAMTGFEGGASHGIGTREVNDEFKIAHEVRQQLWHDLSWHREPKGGHTVNFDPPLKYTAEPLPKVEIKDA